MLLRFTVLACNIIQMMVKFNHFVCHIARFICCCVTAQPKVYEAIQNVRVWAYFTALEKKEKEIKIAAHIFVRNTTSITIRSIRVFSLRLAQFETQCA